MSTVRADIEIGHEGVLADLEFSDLYLEATGRAWYKTWALDPLRHEITGSALEGVTRLRQHIEASVSKREFRIKWDGVGMRGALFETQAGEMYVLRRNLPHALPFHTLGYGQRVESALLAPAIRTGGLVLFTGGASSGKTVGLTAWTVAMMRTYGGAGYTVENPIEIELEGDYTGEDGVTGTLYQKEIDEDEQFGHEIRRRLRGGPNLLMIGELRNADAVAQALLAATSGVVVGASYHANDQITGLQRLSGMVRDAGFDGGLFANGLAAVIHQQMVLTHREGEITRQLRVSPLILTGSRNETGISSQLHGVDFRQLSTEVDHQRRVMANLSTGVAF